MLSKLRKNVKSRRESLDVQIPHNRSRSKQSPTNNKKRKIKDGTPQENK
jgi:hypothetical protein